MDNGISRSILRCLLVWAAVTAVTILLAVVLHPAAASLHGAFDDALVGVSSWTLLGCAAWAWAATTAVVTTMLLAQDETRAPRGIPGWFHRVVLAACGVALTGGVASPALATPGAVPLDTPDHHGQVVLTGLPYPDRAVAPTPAAGESSPREPTVVVRRGDTLWSIAARRLPAAASDADVALAWRRIYDRNRTLIGADPDRIEPGQRLDLPPSRHSSRKGATP